MPKYILVLLSLFFVNLLFPSSKEKTIDKINNLISSLPSDTKAGVVIYNPMTQDTVFAMNATSPMIPASLTKLFTTAISLNVMGSEHELSTKLFSDDINFNDGILNGNLYIKGFGNSTFSEDDLQDMIEFIANKGITQIDGDIIGDDTYTDDIYTREDWIENELTQVKLPPISALVLDRNRTVVKRKVRRGYRFVTTTIKDPPLFVAQKLKEYLISKGIKVNGNAKKGETPPKVYFLTEKSIQLKDLIALINKHSDNFLAECLFKTLGAEVSGLKGNSFFSQQAIIKFLKDNNIYADGTEIVDGSGLSRYDFATPLAISGILERMYFDLKHFDAFYNSLSIAGVDGTLRGRLVGTPAEGNFRGKTGSLNGVSGLAGYLTDKNGDDLIITIIFQFNKGNWRHYRNIQDQIVALLTEWRNGNSDQ